MHILEPRRQECAREWTEFIMNNFASCTHVIIKLIDVSWRGEVYQKGVYMF
jgi:hypothetical protein